MKYIFKIYFLVRNCFIATRNNAKNDASSIKFETISPIVGIFIDQGWKSDTICDLDFFFHFSAFIIIILKKLIMKEEIFNNLEGYHEMPQIRRMCFNSIRIARYFIPDIGIVRKYFNIM